MRLNFDSVKRGTKISEIKVDPRLRVRDNCGLDFVNEVLSGDAEQRGFTPSTAILFTGTPGAGKSTMGLQLASALSEKGHEVLYNTGEESLTQVKMTYERLKLKGDFDIAADIFVDRPEAKKEAAMIKSTLREDIEALAKRVEERNKGIKDIAKQHRVYVIIDSLQCMNDGKWGLASNGKTPVRVLEELTQMCKDLFVTIIVIGQVGKAGEFKGDNSLLHMVDVHLHLFIDQDPKSTTLGYRILECRKNRFGPSGIATALDLGKLGLNEKNSSRKAARV